jgi:hypothetical protein
MTKAPWICPEGKLVHAVGWSILFIDHYDYRRYHKALGNVTPADVLYGRREAILQRRKAVQILTINRRRDYNQGLRELANAA